MESHLNSPKLDVAIGAAQAWLSFFQIDRQAIRETFIGAAQAAGEVLTRHFHQGVTVRTKQSENEDSYNLVSDADIEAERAIVELIRSAFPAHAILGEEEQKDDAGAEHLWVIDPLDGTNNFVHAIPHFAVSIAYHYLGMPQCGVVFNPIRDDWYMAVRHVECHARAVSSARSWHSPHGHGVA